MLLPAALVAPGDAEAAPGDATSHVALRATTRSSSLRLKGRTSVPENAWTGAKNNTI